MLEKQVEIVISFPSKCRTCKFEIEKGEKAIWYPESREVECKQCYEEIDQ